VVTPPPPPPAGSHMMPMDAGITEFNAGPSLPCPVRRLHWHLRKYPTQTHTQIFPKIITLQVYAIPLFTTRNRAFLYPSSKYRTAARQLASVDAQLSFKLNLIWSAEIARNTVFQRPREEAFIMVQVHLNSPAPRLQCLICFSSSSQLRYARS